MPNPYESLVTRILIDQSRFSVRYKVIGTEENVNKWFEAYEKEWPAQGYGTSIRELSREGEQVTYRVYRSLSCD